MTRMRYHMGCGEQRIDGYVGVDIRKTGAADLVVDLNDPELPEARSRTPSSVTRSSSTSDAIRASPI